MLSNNTRVVEEFRHLNESFDRLITKRAFVHWFVSEGMDEMELHEARQKVKTLEQDY
jgi:tubulin alpha